MNAPRSSRSWRPTKRRLAVAAVGISALVVVPTVASVGQTEAAWVSSEYATTTVTAGSVATPVVAQACVNNVVGATMYWGPATTGLAPSGYVVGIYFNNVLVGSEVLLNASTFQRGTLGLLSSLDGRTYQFRVQAYVANPGGQLWRSQPLYGTIVTTALGLVSSCSGLRTTP